MKQVSIDCPHCGTNDVAATLRTIAPCAVYEASFFVTCNRCHGGLIQKCRLRTAIDPGYIGSSFSSDEKIPSIDEVLWTAPMREQPKQIEYLSPRVHKAFLEAEANFSDRRWASAAIGYRRAIEIALKELYPDMTGTLYKRIGSLQADNALPTALVDLMHHVRFLGNDGAHEMDDPEPEDVTAGREFANLLLIYLIELPERVRIAAEKRDTEEVG